MTARWEIATRSLVAHLSNFGNVEAEESWYTDGMVSFTFNPDGHRFAKLVIVASQSELLIFAGEGARFELAKPIESSEDAAAIAKGIMAGRLQERRRFGCVQFKLDIGGRKSIRGASWTIGLGRRKTRGWFSYDAYPGIASCRVDNR